MKATVLTFPDLSFAAAFLSAVQPCGYRLNTVTLRLTARLTDLERAIATEQYSGVVVGQEEVLADA